MSQFSIEEISQEIEKIVENFNNLQCYQCAKEILKWLKANKIKGTLIRLRTKYDEDYIVSTRLENLGITESITANGTHYGVEVQGIVFDNLARDGMSREDWLNDFHCPSEQFIVEEL
ncbi:MAG: hypothetical protein F6K65_05030 [Moorea sp. SIO3C2]|nr:hypothetical protein [Moorena sp. SIO3C2]